MNAITFQIENLGQAEIDSTPCEVNTCVLARSLRERIGSGPTSVIRRDEREGRLRYGEGAQVR